MPPGADLFNAAPQRIFLFQVGKCISLNSGVIFPFIFFIDFIVYSLTIAVILLY